MGLTNVVRRSHFRSCKLETDVSRNCRDGYVDKALHSFLLIFTTDVLSYRDMDE